MLAFKEGLNKLLKDSMNSRDFESEALLVSKLTKIIRKEIFQWKKFHFTGKFPPECQNDSVPTLIKSLVSMLINGQNMENQGATESQACLTISQLIYFHAKINTMKCQKHGTSRIVNPPSYLPGSTSPYHHQEQEAH